MNRRNQNNQSSFSLGDSNSAGRDISIDSDNNNSAKGDINTKSTVGDANENLSVDILSRNTVSISITLLAVGIAVLGAAFVLLDFSIDKNGFHIYLKHSQPSAEQTNSQG
jgi:hypothetical protein